jgi:predicted DNA-binding transcriptional regulator AlpA
MIADLSQQAIRPLYWRTSDLPHLTRLSASTIARLRKAKRLPPPDLAAGRALCWKPETITSWIDSGGLSGKLS